jgi:type I restriction-modification system DNA methylase subunit
MANHSELSTALTKSLPKDVKKKEGIFFTPTVCVNLILSLIEPYIKDVSSILEPSCGSGEFITALRTKYPNTRITGIEYNKTIYDAITPKLSSSKTKIIHADFISHSTNQKHGLIIGNPPFVVAKKKDIPSEYFDYFTGRPNLFVPFIIKSISLLSDNGILCFILPKNFMNCHYYDKTRAHIVKTCDILNISECDGKYMDTQQQTIVLIVRKRDQGSDDQTHKGNPKYVLNVSDYTIFTQGNGEEIAKLYENSTTLANSGFKASVGNVVWNQEKAILTDDTTQTRLIYSSDFNEGVFTPKEGYKNPDKKCYIHREGTTDPVIVINRGYGKGAYKFGYCLLDLKSPYLLENHIMEIRYLNTGNVSRDELIKTYEKLIKSFEDPRTKKFIKLYFSNDAMNTTELNTILPIYL